MPSGRSRSTSGSGGWTGPRRASGSASSRRSPACWGSRWARSRPISSLRFTRRAYLIWPRLAVAIAVPCIVGTILEPDRRTVADLPVRGLDHDGLGARAEQHRDGERRPRQPEGGRLCPLHLPGPPVRRHQLAAPDRLRLRPGSACRCIAASRLGQWLESIGARPRPRPTGPSNLTAGDARRRADAGPRLPLLPPRGSKHLPADQEKARQPEGGDALWPSRCFIESASRCRPTDVRVDPTIRIGDPVGRPFGRSI